MKAARRDGGGREGWRGSRWEILNLCLGGGAGAARAPASDKEVTLEMKVNVSPLLLHMLFYFSYTFFISLYFILTCKCIVTGVSIFFFHKV